MNGKEIESTLYDLVINAVDDNSNAVGVQVHCAGHDHFWVTFVLDEDDTPRRDVITHLFACIKQHSGLAKVEFEIAYRNTVMLHDAPKVI